VYDDLDRLVTEHLPNPIDGTAVGGPQTTWVYDLAGNVLSTTDALGRTTTYSYDALDRQKARLSPDPDGAGPLLAPAVTNYYDDAGYLHLVIERLSPSENLTTVYEYDALGRQVFTQEPVGSASGIGYSTTYTFDTESNLLSLTDGSGNTTSYVYDDWNRVISETNQLNDTRSFEYDDQSNRTAVVDRNGRRTEFTYDSLDRLVNENWLDGGSTIRTIHHTYDDAGRLASASDPDYNYSYSYDRLDRLTQTSNAGTPGLPLVTFDYSYDAVGNLLSSIETIGSDTVTVDYVYDGLDRPISLSQSGTTVSGKSAALSYNAIDQLTSVTRYSSHNFTGEVVTTDYAFDAANRMTDLTHRDGGNVLADYSYQFDAVSRITNIQSLADGNTSLTLDANGQLLSADHTAQADESYQYDPSGNRTGGGYLIGQNNQMLSDGVYAYQYDGEGNRVKRTELVGGQPTGAYTEYSWDHRNRLTFVSDFTATGILTSKTAYRYDTNDLRLSRGVDVDGNGTTDQTNLFVLDGGNVAAVLDENGAATNRYFRGPGIDQVFADENGLGDVLWPLADHQGTVRDLAAEVGGITQVANHRVYDTFGNLQSETDAAVDHLFGYTGREYDEQTDLHYYRSRWYDSGTGEFIGEDSIGFAGGDANLTRYVGNSPVDFIDPLGQSQVDSGVTSFFSTALDIGSSLLSTAYDVGSSLLGSAYDIGSGYVDSFFGGGSTDSFLSSLYDYGSSFYSTTFGGSSSSLVDYGSLSSTINAFSSNFASSVYDYTDSLFSSAVDFGSSLVDTFYDFGDLNLPDNQAFTSRSNQPFWLGNTNGFSVAHIRPAERAQILTHEMFQQ
ncbi:MAG: hypothetical protein MI861_26985, partial [Pirellulales bacterium]|nr:hypothetical protein [Pirellulales bacterium]